MLLELEGVTLRRHYGDRIATVLNDVSLTVDSGELVAVWGRKCSGRSTLLRVAGGIFAPDEGVVRFESRDLASGRKGWIAHGMALRDGHMGSHEPTLEGVAGLVSPGRGFRRQRREHYDRALELCGVADLRSRSPWKLTPDQRIRLAISYALVGRPRLLLLDEPHYELDVLEHDALSCLLRAIADDGVAILMAVDYAGDGAGCDRLVTLGGGRLRGDTTPSRAPVVPIAPANA